MTREEAIESLRHCASEDKCPDGIVGNCYGCNRRIALNMAIEALSAEPKDILKSIPTVELLAELGVASVEELMEEPLSHEEAWAEIESDLISRADAIEAVKETLSGNVYWDYVCDALKALKALPSADAVSMEEHVKELNDLASAWKNKFINAEKRTEKIYDETMAKVANECKECKERLRNLRPSAEAVHGWIPFTRRPMTEEEQKDYPNCTFIFDCVLPDDGEEILVSNGRFVWMDAFCNDIDGCYLDGGDDIDEDMAWMPLPTPYKGGDE